MSTSDKKKSKSAKKAPERKSKAKVTKTKKVVKAVAVEKPKKVEKVEKVTKVKKVEKKEAAPKSSPKPQRVKLGPAPSAVISARHIDSMQERSGRGFSFSELSSAGVPLVAAKREGLSVDVRRRSAVQGNVDVLKAWFKSPVASKADQGGETVAVATVTKKK